MLRATSRDAVSLGTHATGSRYILLIVPSVHETLLMETQPPGQLRHEPRQMTQAEEEPDDNQLLRRFVTARDEEAFARLVQRHGPLVLSVCRRVLHHYQDAEDAFQATFLVLARKARLIRHRGALAGWLYKVAYNLAVRLQMTTQRRRHAERQRQTMPSTHTQDSTTWEELRQVLDEELSHLPEKYRVPLLLCCLAGQTRDEAARQLGWTLGTLKMRLERGRQLLRSRLARRGLTLTTVLLALLLAQHTAARALPAVLQSATVRSSLSSAAGHTPAVLSDRVISLARYGGAVPVSKPKLFGLLVVVILSVLLVGILVLLPAAAPGGTTAKSDGAGQPAGRAEEWQSSPTDSIWLPIEQVP